jgi:hypothetical protein
MASEESAKEQDRLPSNVRPFTPPVYNISFERGSGARGPSRGIAT